MSSHLIKAGQSAARAVQPFSSLDKNEAKRKVRALYKAWYRQVPYTRITYELHQSEDQMKAKIKEHFVKNKDVEDLRVVDYLIFRGQTELYEVVNVHKFKAHLCAYWNHDTKAPYQKPKDFLGKFLDGN